MIDQRTTVKLTKDIQQKVDDLSNKLGQTRSALIRTAIVEYLNNWEAIE